MYKAVINDNYLCHYNKNHSKANGQFVSGDGDGDGIPNDHAARSKESKKKGLSKKAKVGLAIAGGVVGTAAIVAGAVGLGKEFSNVSRAKKLNDATTNGVASKGKSWWENNKTYQRISAEAELRQKVKDRWQPEGWDKNVSLKSDHKIGSYEYYKQLVKGSFINPEDLY